MHWYPATWWVITPAWWPRQRQHLPAVWQPHQQDSRKRWWRVCLVNPPGRCPPAGGLGEHWGLTKPGRCGCSNRHAPLSMISDHLSWKHVVFKNISMPFSPLGWLFLIFSCPSKMPTTLAVTSWGLFYAHDNLRHLNCISSPWKEDIKSSAIALPGTINKGNPGMNA